MKTTPLQEKTQKAILERFKDLDYYAPLPGERELCLDFNVSRPTIRRVLDNLEQQNMIVRIQGRGTFYIGKKVPIDFSDSSEHGLGLFNILTSAGKYTKSHVLTQVVELPRAEIAARLDIGKTDRVFHLKRLRFVNDEIYSLADDYIPLAICPQLMKIDFSEYSLIKALEENAVIAARDDKVIEVVPAGEGEAAYLELEKGDPISVVSIVTYDEAGTIVQYATSKADAYKSRVRVISARH